MKPGLHITSTEGSTSTGRARKSSAWRILRICPRKKSNVWFKTIPAATNGSSTSPPSRLNQSNARLRLPLGEVERSVEDRLREEYFTLLPEIRRVADQPEAEVKYHIRFIAARL